MGDAFLGMKFLVTGSITADGSFHYDNAIQILKTDVAST